MCAHVFHVFNLFYILFNVCYSLFKDRVPHRDWQQAVNIVSNGAPLDKQEHSDHHCHTYTHPGQGMAGNLHTYTGETPTNIIQQDTEVS